MPLKAVRLAQHNATRWAQMQMSLTWLTCAHACARALLGRPSAMMAERRMAIAHQAAYAQAWIMRAAQCNILRCMTTWMAKKVATDMTGWTSKGRVLKKVQHMHQQQNWSE